MKRPLGRFGALALSLAVFYIVVAVMLVATIGFGPNVFNGPLMRPTNWLFDNLSPLMGDDLARMSIFFLLTTPPGLCALLLYIWLAPRAPRPDEHLRCLRCGYILKGLSEPRCPECGERI
ncbi:MAG: hypothetical protein ABIG44_05130 [Planctomycetota bacterium]